VASQKFICPRVSAVAPACTVAVKVTTVPPEIEDTVFPFEVRERVVAVAWDAQAGWGPHQARHAMASEQGNKTSGAGRPPTVGRKRISPIFQLKRIFLLPYLTKQVRVLFPGKKQRCASRRTLHFRVTFVCAALVLL
jgi:hypothetical protein